MYFQDSATLDVDSRISLCLALLDSDSTKEMVEDWCVKSEVNGNTGNNKVVSSGLCGHKLQ